MEVTFDQSTNALVVSIHGRLDTNTSPEAEEAIFEKIESGENRLILNLENTEYVSSSGLRILLKTAKRIKMEEGKFCLCQASQQNLEVLKISGFMTIIEYFETLDDAIAFHGV